MGRQPAACVGELLEKQRAVSWSETQPRGDKYGLFFRKFAGALDIECSAVKGDKRELGSFYNMVLFYLKNLWDPYHYVKTLPDTFQSIYFRSIAKYHENKNLDTIQEMCKL